MQNEANSRTSKTEHGVVTGQRVSTRCRRNRTGARCPGTRCQILFLVSKTARKNQEQSLTPSLPAVRGPGGCRAGRARGVRDLVGFDTASRGDAGETAAEPDRRGPTSQGKGRGAGSRGLTRGGMAANPVAIAVRAEKHKRLRRGEKIAHPSRMASGIAPTDRSALMDATQDSQLHRNRLESSIHSSPAGSLWLRSTIAQSNNRG